MINLAMSRSANALTDEDIIVRDLGLVYVHLPVVWENPTLEDVKLFFVILENFRDRQVWIHCAKNMRVSCFVYLWQKYVLKLPEATARKPMDSIWQPTGVWQQLIEAAKISL